MEEKFVTEAAARPEAEGINPAVITAIIAAIMQILAGCKPPAPTPAQVIAGGGRRGERVLFQALLKNGIRPLSAEGRAAAAAIRAQAAATSEADAADFLAQCQCQ